MSAFRSDPSGRLPARRTAAVAGLLAGLVCVGLWAGGAVAAPAPWHWWRSKIDGQRVCAQTSPGPGWEEDGGPFDGPGCQPRPRVFVLPMR